jgi:hypothetical protein
MSKDSKNDSRNNRTSCSQCHHRFPTEGCTCTWCDCELANVLPDVGQPVKLSHSEASQLIHGYSRVERHNYEE